MRLNSVALLVPLRSVQFSSWFLFVCLLSSPTFLEHLCTCVTLDARGCLAWTSLGIIFLRSLHSKFMVSRRLNSVALLVPLVRSVQFSSVQFSSGGSSTDDSSAIGAIGSVVEVEVVSAPDATRAVQFDVHTCRTGVPAPCTSQYCSTSCRPPSS